MKGFSSKCIALKIDVIGPENVLFASPEILQAGAVKGLIFCNLSLSVTSVNWLHQESEI